MVKKIIAVMFGLSSVVNVAHATHLKGIDHGTLECMVRVSLAEGENQTKKTKIGIMYTIHNRVKDKAFKSKSHCTIANSRGQFSHRKVKQTKKHLDLFNLAKLVVLEYIKDPTDGATFFHDDSLKRNPFRHTARTVQLDNMLFYKRVSSSSA